MKQFVFLCVIIMMSSAGFAQRVLQTSTNAYLNADKIVKQQISCPVLRMALSITTTSVGMSQMRPSE